MSEDLGQMEYQHVSTPRNPPPGRPARPNRPGSSKNIEFNYQPNLPPPPIKTSPLPPPRIKIPSIKIPNAQNNAEKVPININNININLESLKELPAIQKQQPQQQQQQPQLSILPVQKQPAKIVGMQQNVNNKLTQMKMSSSPELTTNKLPVPPRPNRQNPQNQILPNNNSKGEPLPRINAPPNYRQSRAPNDVLKTNSISFGRTPPPPPPRKGGSANNLLLPRQSFMIRDDKIVKNKPTPAFNNNNNNTINSNNNINILANDNINNNFANNNNNNNVVGNNYVEDYKVEEDIEGGGARENLLLTGDNQNSLSNQMEDYTNANIRNNYFDNEEIDQVQSAEQLHIDLPQTSKGEGPTKATPSPSPSSLSSSELRKTIILQLESKFTEDDILVVTKSAEDEEEIGDEEEEEEEEEDEDEEEIDVNIKENSTIKAGEEIDSIEELMNSSSEKNLAILQNLSSLKPEKKRVSVRRMTTKKEGDWEGWQRRVKRQTWEEWESNFVPKKSAPVSRTSTLIGKKINNNNNSNKRKLNKNNKKDVLINARDGDIDGRAVSPYWLLKWWLTKNTTNRPTISRQPLLELLLEDNLAVVTALSEVLKSDEANQFAFCIVRIFEGCCKIMPLITHFVKREIESTIHGNTLFRTNTIATKIMSSYAKIAGGSYLRKLLYPIIHFIIEQDLTIEIDEKKIKENSLPINEQVALLLKITQQFLDHIVSQIGLIPIMFRRICNCLLVLVKEKFEDENQYHGIGGFIFLRFICPAIVAPDAFSIIKTKLTSGVRRTFVLISKVLQNLANGIKHAKEEYMTPTDVFIEDNYQKIQDFFSTLAIIPDLPSESHNFGIIPIPLIEESLSIIHRLIIREIDKLKEELINIEVVELVPYDIAENLNTVILKSAMVIEQLKSKEEIDNSSPLYKPYFLFIDATLATGCYIIRTLIPILQNETEAEFISEALMVIVHSNGNSLEFIKQYILEEVKRSETVNIAFNTMNISTHIIWGYFKVLTREFIYSIWADLIHEINQSNLNLEIDPLRLNNPTSIMIENNVNQLIKISKLMIDKLFLNISKLHPRVKEMCDYIQSQMTKKFGNNVDKYYATKLLSKRIFSTAISYPAVFHLLSNIPEFYARRTLVLSAKLLCNVVLNFQSKEFYMAKLNDFARDYQPKAILFLEQLRRADDLNSESTFSLSWDIQRESLTQIHNFLMKHLIPLTEKIKDQKAEETIIYNVFDRLAAVIALYRYKLRRKSIMLK